MSTQNYINEQLNKGTFSGLAFALHANEDRWSRAHRGSQEYTGEVSIGHIWQDMTPLPSEIVGAIWSDVPIIRGFTAVQSGKKLPIHDLAQCGCE